MAQTQSQSQAPGEHDRHGNSVAAWTAVTLIMFGALIMCVSVAFTTWWLTIVGAVVVVAGGISGKVLTAMGFGVSGKPGH